MILADNGSAWYVSGAPDDRWSNSNLALVRRITGNDFEAVDESALMISSDSGGAVQEPRSDESHEIQCPLKKNCTKTPSTREIRSTNA